MSQFFAFTSGTILVLGIQKLASGETGDGLTALIMCGVFLVCSVQMKSRG